MNRSQIFIGLPKFYVTHRIYEIFVKITGPYYTGCTVSCFLEKRLRWCAFSVSWLTFGQLFSVFLTKQLFTNRLTIAELRSLKLGHRATADLDRITATTQHNYFLASLPLTAILQVSVGKFCIFPSNCRLEIWTILSLRIHDDEPN